MQTNKQVLDQVNNVMLCVKPKDVVKFLKETANDFHSNHLLMSIAAGIQLNQIHKVFILIYLLIRILFSIIKFLCFKYLIKEARIIRIMMNINCLVHKSCSVFSKGINATDGY
jgi:pyrroline-5-carboxylate reductase